MEENFSNKTTERDWLRLPVVSAGAEFLVMGHLMRRNILTYKAPPNNEDNILANQNITIRANATYGTRVTGA